MTVTLDLPDELSSRLTALIPEETRDRFAAAAIADALNLRQLETEECVPIVEQALADMDAGRNLVSFEEVCDQWDADRAERNTLDGK